MFFNEALYMIRKMYLTGGVEIVTRGPSDSTAMDTDLPIYAWTLIQPDGDVIYKVSDRVFAHPNVWQRHIQNVDQRIAVLRRFRGVLKWVSTVSLLTSLLAGYTSWRAVKEGDLITGVLAVGGFLLSIALVFFRFSISRLLRWHIRRRIMKW